MKAKGTLSVQRQQQFASPAAEVHPGACVNVLWGVLFGPAGTETLSCAGTFQGKGGRRAQSPSRMKALFHGSQKKGNSSVKGGDDDDDNDEWRSKTCVFSVLWTTRNVLADEQNAQQIQKWSLFRQLSFQGVSLPKNWTKGASTNQLCMFGGFISRVSIKVQPSIPEVCNSW